MHEAFFACLRYARSPLSHKILDSLSSRLYNDATMTVDNGL